jgi:hypothetical protein
MQDHLELLKDLDSLQQWARTRGICFNATKCYKMGTGRARDQEQSPLALQSRLHADENSPSTTTLWWRCVGNALIHWFILPSIPYDANLCNNLWWGTVSNALLKSKITRSTCFFISNDFMMSFMVIMSWLSQECPLRNPCCNGVSILFLSRCLGTWRQVMCSSNLQHTQVSACAT